MDALQLASLFGTHTHTHWICVPKQRFHISAFIRFHFSSALFLCECARSSMCIHISFGVCIYYNYKRPYEFADLMELLLAELWCGCVHEWVTVCFSLSFFRVLFLVFWFHSKCTSFCFYIVIEIASGMRTHASDEYYYGHESKRIHSKCDAM